MFFPTTCPYSGLRVYKLSSCFIWNSYYIQNSRLGLISNVLKTKIFYAFWVTTWNQDLWWMFFKQNFHLQVNLCQKLLFLQNMGRTCFVHKMFWMSKSINVHNMFSPCSELGLFTYWTCNSMNTMSSYCGLVDAKIRASDKDLPVLKYGFCTKSLRKDETLTRWTLFWAYLSSILGGFAVAVQLLRVSSFRSDFL